MMITHTMQQGTPEWLEVRKGKMTASHAQEIGNGYKNGKLGKGLETYIYKLLAEEYSSGEVEYYSNKDMARGNELEGQARAMYKLENDVEVKQVGFIELDEYVGCSPDGLIGDDGMIEIKCHDDVKHFKLLVNGAKEIESKYIWQIQMQMFITGRKYCNYVAYNPNFKRSLFTKRFHVDTEKFAQIKVGLEAGKGRIKALKFLI